MSCAFLSAFLVVFSAGLVSSQEESVSGERPVAIIGDRIVYPADVEAIFQTRRKNLPEDPEEAWQRALETLVAEIAIEVQMDALGASSAEEVAVAVADARRQILLELYAQSQFEPTLPSEEDIEAYVAENPLFFDERSEFRFLRITVRPRNETDRKIATEALEDVLGLPSVTEEVLDGLALVLARKGIPFNRELFWNGGEVLEPDTLRRIEVMSEESREIDISETRERIDLIRLFDSRAAPIDPTFLRAQIEDRVILQRFEKHRAELVQGLAEPHLVALRAGEQRQSPAVPRPEPTGQPPRIDTAPADPEDQPRFDRTSVALAAFGVLSALAGFGTAIALQWVRSAGLFAEEAGSLGNRSEYIRVFDRKSTASACTAIGILALVAVLPITFTLGQPSLPLQPAAVFGGGGAVLGLIIGAIHVKSQPIDVARPVSFARLLLTCVVIQLAVMAALVAFA